MNKGWSSLCVLEIGMIPKSEEFKETCIGF
jgi:hypothetical protein